LDIREEARPRFTQDRAWSDPTEEDAEDLPEPFPDTDDDDDDSPHQTNRFPETAAPVDVASYLAIEENEEAERQSEVELVRLVCTLNQKLVAVSQRLNQVLPLYERQTAKYEAILRERLPKKQQKLGSDGEGGDDGADVLDRAFAVNRVYFSVDGDLANTPRILEGGTTFAHLMTEKMRGCT
jgi:hypothetical protein